MKKVILKKGKEKAILQRHHWIFSGAIENFFECEKGEILEVFSNLGIKLGSGYFNKEGSLCGRLLSFGDEKPLETLEKNFLQSIALRKELFDDHTNTYRLVNGEGDLLPGLILDQYNDAIVMQIGTWGMFRLKSFIISLIKKHLPSIRTIYEKSKSQEGLKDFNGHHMGQDQEVIVLENGIKFLVNFAQSQKTGLFLDQRQMRLLVQKLAKGKRVLNCFGYTGGFSLYAAKGGSQEVTTVDISEKALQIAKHNFFLNQLDPGNLICQDAFDYLKNPLPFDLVILDPPAFAKKKEDIRAAFKAYLNLNRQTLEKLAPKSLLLTCSCSYHIDQTLFQKLIFQAAHLAKREVKILSMHHLAPDHPINIYHPESQYLKSLLLFVH